MLHVSEVVPYLYCNKRSTHGIKRKNRVLSFIRIYFIKIYFHLNITVIFGTDD